MKRIFYSISVLLMFVWLLGFFVLGAGPLIHTLVVGAAIFYLQALITKPKPKMQE